MMRASTNLQVSPGDRRSKCGLVPLRVPPRSGIFFARIVFGVWSCLQFGAHCAI